MEYPKEKNLHPILEAIENARECNDILGDSCDEIIARTSELLYCLPVIKLLLIYDIVFNMVQDSTTNVFFERKLGELFECAVDNIVPFNDSCEFCE